MKGLEKLAEMSAEKREKVERDLYEKYVVYGDNHEFVTHGRDLAKVIRKARKKGVKIPAIVYVPDPNKTYVLSAA